MDEAAVRGSWGSLVRSLTSLRAVLLVCALLAFGCSDAGNSSGNPFSPEQIAQVDQTIGDMLDAGLSAGTMLTVTTPNGTWTKAYGISDTASGAPMSPELVFRIGSITKTFTVTVLLQLVDERRLGLDDAIGNYLAGVPHGDRVTLREMADMTSGIPSYTENQQFIAALVQDLSRDWQPQELLTYAYDQDFRFPPGSAFDYSNTNTVLLGLLIEQIEKKPIGEVFRERIFGKLGLAHTSWPEDASFPAPHVHGYSETNLEGTLQDATGYSPSEAFTAGEIISDLADLRVWIRSLALGGLLTPATQLERLTYAPVAGNSPERFYALGIFGINGWLGHDGDIPGYTSFAMYNPELDASIVVTANADTKFQGYAPASAVIKAVSGILFPGHIIDNGH